ncbi:MAG TPA: acyl-CoA dehydrogenase [Clostridia bacterium]|nr:acyl-CoA dehydrogenase [Clostridia bacterium]
MANDFVRGGSFLVEDAENISIFTPEDFTDEHRMIAKTAEDFINGEVKPKIDRIEAQEEGLAKELLRAAGELGLLSADIPEEYGGAGLDKISSILITEKVAPSGSFAVSFAAHTGIGTLPIVFFGNKAQKEKYLPALASGEKIAAYALTEPSAGSDALAAKTKAVRSADGTKYILNGEKIFITNAGFADVFVTYAKIDGEHFTAFIVDADAPGLSTGAEEKKMGIKGSSTRSVIFEDCEVPAENVLGEIGKGHLVAFNILNIGRYKLAAAAVGAAKEGLAVSVKYAKERKQFNQSIAEFGAIKHKIAEMAAKTYAAESVVYRTGGLIDSILSTLDPNAEDAGRAAANAIGEYAIECSINKVFGSEVADFVADEAVQIHGGYGFTQEYPVERMYRDSRINRIFEGTNEINRLLIPATLLRKAMKGEVPLLGAAQKLQSELLSLMPVAPEGVLGVEFAKLANMKKMFLMTAGIAAQKLGMALKDEQEILINAADMVIEIYAAESALLRAKKAIATSGEAAADLKIKMAKLYTHNAFQKCELIAKNTLAAVESGDSLKTLQSALKKLARFDIENTIALRRAIADAIIEAEKYIC